MIHGMDGFDKRLISNELSMLLGAGNESRFPCHVSRVQFPAQDVDVPLPSVDVHLPDVEFAK